MVLSDEDAHMVGHVIPSQSCRQARVHACPSVGGYPRRGGEALLAGAGHGWDTVIDPTDPSTPSPFAAELEAFLRGGS